MPSEGATALLENSQLLQLFSRLSASQLRKLRLFLRSPYFNRREDVYALFEYLRADQKRKHPKLEREAVFSALYPDDKHDDSRLNFVVHALLTQIKQFLALQEFEQEEQMKELYQCRALRKVGAEKPYKKSFEKLKKDLENHPYQNVGFHYLNYQLYQEEYIYIASQRRAGRMNLEELVKELTIFYLADILRHSCSILTAQRISKEAYELELLEEVLRYVERSSVKHTPAIAIYHQAYHLLVDTAATDEQGFSAFECLIEQHWQQFPPHEIRDIYLLAINYCIQRLNRGQRQFIVRALGLYKQALERNILLENGQLSKFTYNNVLMLALACQEFEWADYFLHQFKSKLPEKERENIFHYNLAVYYFRKPDYDQALTLLNRQLVFDDIFYNLNSRSMLLQIYFEKGLFDLLFSHLDSFATFISRKKQLGYHRENYLNLISFVRKLLNTPESDKVAREQLRANIAATEAVADKKWLLAQL
jgi:hypothetical protein